MTAVAPLPMRQEPEPTWLWAAVDRLVEESSEDDLDDLIEHRIHLLAARRWRALGRPVPPAVVREERLAALGVITAPLVLRRVRELSEGPILLLKGPEAAARYPDPALRPFKDLDLLVADAPAVQRALLEAGFKPVGNPALYVGIHHQRPLWLPGQPLVVEIHSEPKWPDGIAPPPVDELFALGVPSAVGVAGVHALPGPVHALTLAAHSWAHEPLRRLIELVDVAALAHEGDRTELAALARRWGIERIWRATLGASDALLSSERRRTWPLRLWARNLEDVRGRTVLESHLERWLAGYWSHPPAQALREMLSAAAREVRPAQGESWQAKLVRTRRAFQNAFAARTAHDREWSREEPEIRPK
jgi:Uncharacterised nucleotidyltransferase